MIIETAGLTKRYGTVTALAGLDLAVAEGGIFAFLGPNGAGKTTTIRIMNGLTKKDSGIAKIAGMDVENGSERVKRQCGFASQNINLDGELTVAQNLDFHGRLYGMPRERRRTMSAELLSYVEMSDRADSLVKSLSGGMKRRIMVARALMHQPRILFLDEPTAGLDPAIRRRIWNLIKKIRKDGVSIFLTTHYIEEAEMLADRVAFIDGGKVVAEGAPEQHVSRLGQWAVDRYGESDVETTFFTDRDEANTHVQEIGKEVTLRRVNLEDAFISLTGKRVQ